MEIRATVIFRRQVIHEIRGESGEKGVKKNGYTVLTCGCGCRRLGVGPSGVDAKVRRQIFSADCTDYVTWSSGEGGAGLAGRERNERV